MPSRRTRREPTATRAASCTRRRRRPLPAPGLDLEVHACYASLRTRGWVSDREASASSPLRRLLSPCETQAEVTNHNRRFRTLGRAGDGGSSPRGGGRRRVNDHTHGGRHPVSKPQALPNPGSSPLSWLRPGQLPCARGFRRRLRLLIAHVRTEVRPRRPLGKRGLRSILNLLAVPCSGQ